MEAFRVADGGGGKRLVNIGCNKGADIAAFFHRWDPTFRYSDWVAAAQTVFSGKVAGACRQLSNDWLLAPPRRVAADDVPARCPSGSATWGCTCQHFSDFFGASTHSFARAYRSVDRRFWRQHNCTTTPQAAESLSQKHGVSPPPTVATPARPTAHCVEILGTTVAALKQTAAVLPSRSRAASLLIEHLAIGSGYPEMVATPTLPAGIESAALVLSDRGTVSHMTLDEYMRKYPAGSVDFLIVDTEGNDPLVLFGGSRTLRRTRFIMFENHVLGEWMRTSLQTVVDFLDMANFECFWAGSDGALWQVTGCNAFITFQGWSNLVCGRRGDLFLNILRRLAADNGGLAGTTATAPLP